MATPRQRAWGDAAERCTGGIALKAKIYKVLFLCTGNSVRSIIAECVLNKVGEGRFEAFSAGSAPKGEIHPLVLELLERQGYPTSELRSKSWDEFAGPGAPCLDVVITLCDSAAKESCPLWLGQIVRAHWELPDPAAVVGGEEVQRAAFAETHRTVSELLTAFTSLPVGALDSSDIQGRLEEMYHAAPEGQSRLATMSNRGSP